MHIPRPFHINDLPIRRKFILLYLFCVLIPIVILQAFVMHNTTTEIRAREAQNAAMSFDRVQRKLENQFANAVTLANAIAVDETLLNGIAESYINPRVYFARYFVTLRPRILRFLSPYTQQISNITLYVENPTTLSGGHILHLSDEVRAQPWYIPQNASASMRLFQMQSGNMSGGMQRWQLSLVRPLHNARVETLMRLDLNMDPIYRALEEERDYLSVFLIAPNGSVIRNRDDASPVESGDFSAEPFDLLWEFGSTTAMNGWRLTAKQRLEPLQESLRRATWMSLLIALICSAFAGVLSYHIVHSILRRSKLLLAHMDVAGSGHFQPITEDLGHDEIGELVLHFNDMSARLSQLIREVYTLELQKKSLELERVRAELKYLQAQIDPHFLFNTLNAILVVSVKQEYTEVSAVIRALSKLMRRVADASDDLIPLREELDFTRMYLSIESFRFGERLHYELDTQDETLDVLVPKMSLQALAENACKHGVQHAQGQGHIRIEARIEGETLAFWVHDNGIGIPAQQLDALRNDLCSSADRPGNVGLQNIHRRLALHYHGEARLEIHSVPGQGTTIEVALPVRKGGERHAPGSIGG